MRDQTWRRPPEEGAISQYANLLPSRALASVRLARRDDPRSRVRTNPGHLARSLRALSQADQAGSLPYGLCHGRGVQLGADGTHAGLHPDGVQEAEGEIEGRDAPS